MATDFSTKTPAEVLEPSALARYTDDIDYLHERLGQLHQTVYFMQEIADFPSEIFTHLKADLFLRFVYHNFFQIAVLHVTKLTTDAGENSRTLSQFKNFIGRSIRQEYAEDYRERLANARFSARTKAIIKKAEWLRNTHIAHSSTQSVNILTFAELKEAVAELTKLLNAAVFNSEYRYLTPWYHPEARKLNNDGHVDIERILNSIARESDGIRFPETMPIVWRNLRTTWPEKRLATFNMYRRRCGLEEA